MKSQSVSDWLFLWLLTLPLTPCGGIWFLRSDVHCDAGLLFFWAVAAQHRTRPEDESHCLQNGGIPKQVGRACLQGHDEIGR